MAGGWNHSVEGSYDGPEPKSGGKLLRNEDAVQMLENGGDWYEYAEEAYGMVWWLATLLSQAIGTSPATPAVLIEEARQNYKRGLALSPGTDGMLREVSDD